MSAFFVKLTFMCGQGVGDSVLVARNEDGAVNAIVDEVMAHFIETLASLELYIEFAGWVDTIEHDDSDPQNVAPGGICANGRALERLGFGPGEYEDDDPIDAGSYRLALRAALTEQIPYTGRNATCAATQFIVTSNPDRVYAVPCVGTPEGHRLGWNKIVHCY